jgi:MFS transporter, SP family, arabinose:H+ symporter
VGCINLGAAIGALLAGKLSDTLGRRRLSLLCAFFFALTGIATGWANSFPLFIAMRVCSGVTMGAAALVCPMYIAEIAPAAWRGRLVAFYQLAIVTGLLLAYIANYLLLDTGAANWRWMFSSQAVPALLFFFGLFLVPESPRWLVQQGREAEARAVFERIGSPAYANAEIASVRRSFSQDAPTNWSAIWQPDIRHIVVIGSLIAVFSQIDGQNSVLSYAPTIFAQAGAGVSSAFAQSILVGLIFFLFTFVAIASVDRLGRRTLLLYGAVGLGLTLGGLSYCFATGLTTGYWVLAFVLAFVGTYAATLGPVTWVIVSELFPNRVRGGAMAVATLVLWIANYVTTSLFPVMQERLGLSATFGIHAFVCVVLFVFVRSYVPETKGKSLEEIEQALKR